MNNIVKYVGGIPFTFKNGPTLLASVVAVGPVECFNDTETDGNDQSKFPRSKPVQYLYFRASLRLNSRGYQYAGRDPIEMYLSVADSNGPWAPSNPRELKQVLFMRCNYSNHDEPVSFKCFDPAGVASSILSVQFSFSVPDPNAWVRC